MIRSLLQDAEEEIKRADHLLYVSLKYTRTCDIIKNIISRLIAAFDVAILALLEYSKSKKKLKEVPSSWKNKAELICKLRKNSKSFMDLYFLLRKLDESPYTPREEYRKNITMISKIDGKKLEVDVPTLTEYFKKTKLFLKYAEEEVT